MNSKTDDEVERSLKRLRTIDLPSVEPGCHVTWRPLDAAVYDDCRRKLASSNSNQLDFAKEVIKPIADLAVKDALEQHFVNMVRSRLDAVDEPKNAWLSPAARIISHDRSEDGELLKMLLACGVDADLPDDKGLRASHWCFAMGRVDLAALVFPCRPCMEAKCNGGFTPLERASRRHEVDRTRPEKPALREDVNNYVVNGGFETRFPTLPELAIRGMWFAVKNLIRRQVVLESEFTEKFQGKTAAEWAEYYGEDGMAKEIRYYALNLSSRFEETAKQMTALAEQFCGGVDKISQLEEQVKQLQYESAQKDAENAELSEAVNVFRARLEEAGVDCAVIEPVLKSDKSDESGSDSGCDVDSAQATSLSD